METKDKTKDVEQIVKAMDKGAWNFDLLIQRMAGQWTNEQQSLLIDTIIRGYKMPAIWLTETVSESFMKYSVVDGKQRCTTIYDFVKNKFKLHKSLEPVTLSSEKYDSIEEDMTVELAGKKFCDLPDAVQEIIMDYEVDIIRMMYYTDEEIEEQFYRLNNGATFTKAQKANVSLGSELAGKLKEVEALPFWEKVKFSKTQRKHGEITACILQCLMLLVGFDFKNFGANEVLRFAEYYSENYNDKDLEYLVQLINKLDKVFPYDEENSKFLKKINIPPLIMTMDMYENMEYTASDEQITEFFCEWFDGDCDNSKYVDACGNGSTGISKVNSRIGIMQEWFKMYVDDIIIAEREANAKGGEE